MRPTFPSGTVPATAELSKAAFERLKALAGDWDGKSTKGWEETLQYRTIAGGTTVLETSFNAHPGQEMATAFYLDGDRLDADALLHGEERAAAGGDGLRRRREDGRLHVRRRSEHPDARPRAHGQGVIRFEGPDRITSRWTWYENGTEKWFEEIVQTRRR